MPRQTDNQTIGIKVKADFSEFSLARVGEEAEAVQKKLGRQAYVRSASILKKFEKSQALTEKLYAGTIKPQELTRLNRLNKELAETFRIQKALDILAGQRKAIAKGYNLERQQGIVASRLAQAAQAKAAVAALGGLKSDPNIDRIYGSLIDQVFAGKIRPSRVAEIAKARVEYYQIAKAKQADARATRELARASEQEAKAAANAAARRNETLSRLQSENRIFNQAIRTKATPAQTRQALLYSQYRREGAPARVALDLAKARTENERLTKSFAEQNKPLKDNVRQSSFFLSNLKYIAGTYLLFRGRNLALSGLSFIGDFISRLEQLRLGVAETTTAAGKFINNITNQQVGLGQQLNLSFIDADRALDKFVNKSIKLGIPLEQLTAAFISSAGAARSAGISLDDTVEIVASLATLAQRLNIPYTQLSRSIDNIFTGLRVQQTQLGVILGLTQKQVQEWRNEGTLAENLKDILAGISGTLIFNLDTFEGIRSSIRSIVEIGSRKIGFLAFEEYKAGLKDFREILLQLLNNEEKVQNLSHDLFNLFHAIRLTFQFLVDNADTVINVMKAVTLGVGGGLLATGIGLAAAGGTVGTGLAVGGAVFATSLAIDYLNRIAIATEKALIKETPPEELGFFSGLKQSLSQNAVLRFILGGSYSQGELRTPREFRERDEFIKAQKQIVQDTVVLFDAIAKAGGLREGEPLRPGQDINIEPTPEFLGRNLPTGIFGGPELSEILELYTQKAQEAIQKLQSQIPNLDYTQIQNVLGSRVEEIFRFGGRFNIDPFIENVKKLTELYGSEINLQTKRLKQIEANLALDTARLDYQKVALEGDLKLLDVKERQRQLEVQLNEIRARGAKELEFSQAERTVQRQLRALEIEKIAADSRSALANLVGRPSDIRDANEELLKIDLKRVDAEEDAYKISLSRINFEKTALENKEENEKNITNSLRKRAELQIKVAETERQIAVIQQGGAEKALEAQTKITDIAKRLRDEAKKEEEKARQKFEFLSGNVSSEEVEKALKPLRTATNKTEAAYEEQVLNQIKAQTDLEAARAKTLVSNYGVETAIAELENTKLESTIKLAELQNDITAKTQEEKKAQDEQIQFHIMRLEKTEEYLRKLKEEQSVIVDIGGILSDSLDKFLFGHENILDSFRDIGQKTGSAFITPFIEETFKQKIGKLDLGFKKNLLGFIPGLGKLGGQKAGKNIAEGVNKAVGVTGEDQGFGEGLIAKALGGIKRLIGIQETDNVPGGTQTVTPPAVQLTPRAAESAVQQVNQSVPQADFSNVQAGQTTTAAAAAATPTTSATAGASAAPIIGLAVIAIKAIIDSVAASRQESRRLGATNASVTGQGLAQFPLLGELVKLVGEEKAGKFARSGGGIAVSVIFNPIGLVALLQDALTRGEQVKRLAQKQLKQANVPLQTEISIGGNRGTRTKYFEEVRNAAELAEFNRLGFRSGKDVSGFTFQDRLRDYARRSGPVESGLNAGERAGVGVAGFLVGGPILGPILGGLLGGLLSGKNKGDPRRRVAQFRRLIEGNPDVSKLRTGEALGIGAVVGERASDAAAVANALTNNFLVLNATLEESQEFLHRVAEAAKISLPEGLNDLRRKLLEGKLTLDQYHASITGLIKVFHDELPPAIDQSALVMASLNEEGRLSTKAFERNLQDLSSTIVEGIPSAFRASFDEGGTVALADSLAETFANTFKDRVTERILQDAVIGKSLTQATLLANKAIDALLKGDTAGFTTLSAQAREAFFAGRTVAIDLLSKIYGPVTGFERSLGGGPAPFYNPTGIGYPSFDTPMAKKIPGPYGQPIGIQAHGQEEISSEPYAKQTHEMVRKALENGAGSSKPVQLTLQLTMDGKKVAEDVIVYIEGNKVGINKSKAVGLA